MAGTVNALFFNAVEHHRREDLLLSRRGTQVDRLSTEDLLTRVRRMALALSQQLGIRPGDRVALLSYNRPEWAVCDYGIMTAGAVTLPLYTTLPAEEVQFILKDGGARAVIVETAEQAAMIESIRAGLPELRWVIGLHGGGGGLQSYQEVLQRGVVGTQQDHRRLADAVRPEDLATIIYTSGTTGVPKGVMLTHGNLASNSAACVPLLDLGPHHRTVSFLPLSHVFQRQIDLSLLSVGGSIAYASSVNTVMEDLPIFRPTIMAVVPRFLEKIHQKFTDGVAAQPEGRRRFVERSLEAARTALALEQQDRPIPLGTAWRRWWGDRLIFRKLRDRLGGSLDYLISGGAPLAPSLAEFFTAVGVPVLQGYGLTETSPVISINTLEANRIGTVGRIVPGHEVRIAEDGEILFRGPSVMKGYFNRPDETAEAVVEGWFHTGDIGEKDTDGYLKITDRKKDLFKTSGGKYIAPQPLEKKLKESPDVLNAVVVGANRKYAAVLIVPNFERIQTAGRPIAERLRDPEIIARFDALLEHVNEGLAGYTTLKKFALLERDFTIEAGEMTPTFKVRRRIIEERYRDIIERLYADGS